MAFRSVIRMLFNKFGFEIVPLAKVDAFIEQRELQRRNETLAEINRLRSVAKIITTKSRGEILWTSREQLGDEAIKRMSDVSTLLDIGCAFRPQEYIDAKIHVCCEPFPEYMERLIAVTRDTSKYVYLACDLKTTCSLFPANSVDTVYLCDVIEHIDRDVAIECLTKLKSIAKSQLILFTPIGYMPQDPDPDGTDQWGMGGAEWQKHLSGWDVSDFPQEDGWTVVACRDFHQVDGYGRPLAEPFGALWAIWNAPD